MKGGDNLKKYAYLFAVAVLSIGFISSVSAWSSSKDFENFEKNSSIYIDSNSHNMNTSFVTNFVANSISGSQNPNIRHSVKSKTLFGWSSASSQDSTVSSANTTYQKFWTAEKTVRVKATWEQTNGYANIRSGSVKLWD